MSPKTKDTRAVLLALFALSLVTLLLPGCGGGGGGGGDDDDGGNPPPGQNPGDDDSRWDFMNWDEGVWS